MKDQQQLPLTGLGFLKNIFEPSANELASTLFAIDLFPYYFQNAPEDDYEGNGLFFSKANLPAFLANSNNMENNNDHYCLRIFFPQIASNEQWQSKLNSLGQVVKFTLFSPLSIASNNTDNQDVILNCFCYEDKLGNPFGDINLSPLNVNEFYQVLHTAQNYNEIISCKKLSLSSLDQPLLTDKILLAVDDKLIGPLHYKINNNDLELFANEACDYFIYVYQYSELKKHILAIKDFKLMYVKAFNENVSDKDKTDFINFEQLSKLISQDLFTYFELTEKDQSNILELCKKLYANPSYLHDDRIYKFADYLKKFFVNKDNLLKAIDDFLDNHHIKAKLLNSILDIEHDELVNQLNPANLIAFEQELYNKLLAKFSSNADVQNKWLESRIVVKTIDYNLQQSFYNFLDDPATFNHIQNLIKQGSLLNEQIEKDYSAFTELNSNSQADSLQHEPQHEPQDAHQERVNAIVCSLASKINIAALYLGFINDILGLLRSIEQYIDHSENLKLGILRLTKISMLLNNCYATIIADTNFTSKLKQQAQLMGSHQGCNAYTSHVFSAFNSISALTYLHPTQLILFKSYLDMKQANVQEAKLKEDNYKAYQQQEFNQLLLDRIAQRDQLQVSIEQSKIELLNLKAQLSHARNEYQQQLAQITELSKASKITNNQVAISNDTNAQNSVNKPIYLANDMLKHNHIYIDGQQIIERVHSFIKSSGYKNFGLNDTANILLCITQGFITTLSGRPGCGKTSLCRLLAQSLGLAHNLNSYDVNNSPYERFTEVSVEKDWRSVKDFVGYYNPISKKLEPSNVLAFNAFKQLNDEALYLMHSSKGVDHTYPYLMLLDEANLSPLEYYWSPLFSACDLDANHRAYLNLGGDHKFILPQQLRFITTINNDHTTEPLSERFIDRSFIITLGLNKTADEQERRANQYSDDQSTITYEQLISAFNSTTNSNNSSLNLCESNDLATAKWQAICELFSQEKLLMPLSERSCNMLKRYCANAIYYMNSTSSDKSLMVLDYALAQKILPTIKGSTQQYQALIEELLRLCPYESMPLSHTHLQRMYQQGMESMFYQFFSF